MPRVDDVGRGDVKTPPLWHTAAKMPVGRWYTDGSFHGRFPLMASSMELEKDRPFDALVETRHPDDQGGVRLGHPPPAAAAVSVRDRSRRSPHEGATLFYSREIGCCALPRRVRRHAATSTGRACTSMSAPTARGSTSCRTGSSTRSTTARSRREGALDEEPTATRPRRSPASGRTIPYLHNGSVPTLHHLLGPVAERPRIFDVMAARRFDRAARRTASLHAMPATLGCERGGAAAPFGADRNWFNTRAPGWGNGGHDVWPRIRTDANRRALIEYLKTL